MKPSELLKKGWCQNHVAINSANEVCEPDAPNAVAWCYLGAFRAIYGCKTDSYDEWFRVGRRVCNGDDPHDFNDAMNRTQAEVVALAEKVEAILGIKE